MAERTQRRATEAEAAAEAARPRFTSSTAAVLAMIGVAVGLGNFWRFPYLVGRFGGAAFVLFYLLLVAAIGVPALMAEWTLGRVTRRGTVGAFQRAGLPGGRFIGWFFFALVLASTAYYTNAVGWVLAFAVDHTLRAAGFAGLDAARVLPPATGFRPGSFFPALAFTGGVLFIAAIVLRRGLRSGIERASRVLVPMTFIILLALIVRGLTLPGASAGLHWYLLKFEPADLTGTVMIAALGQVVFSLSLGGTFMVVYGSFLGREHDLGGNALATASADTAAGLLAGLAIFPAVFAFGLEPGSGPGLIFDTLPRVFASIPAGSLFAMLFFVGLFAVALLSDIAALEVLITGLTDNLAIDRRKAITLIVCSSFVLAIPSLINLRIFVPWDLTFGSGAQTLGAFLAMLTVGWSLDRARVLRELGRQGHDAPRWLYYWVRFVVPGCIMLVFVWWLLTDVLHVAGGV